MILKIMCLLQIIALMQGSLLVIGFYICAAWICVDAEWSPVCDSGWFNLNAEIVYN